MKLKTLATLCLSASLLLCVENAASAKTFDWPIGSPAAKAETFTAYHGETVRFNLRLSGPMTNLAPVAIYYQTNGMGRSEWFTVPGTVFAPSNDCGAATYRFFVRCLDPDGVDYSANGTLRMLDSPGFSPSEVQLPVQTIDFAHVTALNAPWIEEESDPTVPAWAKAENPPIPPDPDFSTNNQQLVDTIVATSPAPGNYANVSNRAMSAVQPDATNALSSTLSSLVSHESQNSTNYTDDALSAYDESLGESLGGLAWQDEESDPVAMPAVQAVSNDVAVLMATLNGETARYVVTNYNNVAEKAAAEVEAKINGEWQTMWRELTRWDWLIDEYLPTNYYTKAECDANFADRAWGAFDPTTGNLTPDGKLWLSAPSIYICAGASYERVANAAGEYWVLTANGMVADINGVSSNGYFRITDSDGVTQFEIVKGDRQTLAAAPNALANATVMGVTHYFTAYAVTNAAAAPTAQFARSLAKPVEWFDETDASCPFNVSWSHPDANTYVCEWWPKTTEPTGFMKAFYQRGGATYIKNSAPVSLDGGIKYGNDILTVAEIGYVVDNAITSETDPNVPAWAKASNPPAESDPVAMAAIADLDTSYRRYVGLTNVNQSVQYVATDSNTTEIAILAPTSGDTKDWVVYVYPATNLTFALPTNVTWWTSDAANTNEIPAATPTALYFSQVSDTIFLLGRQELIEIGGAE